MLKKFFICLLGAVAVSGAALTVDDTFQIVLPPPSGSEALDFAHRIAGEALRDNLRRCAGLKLRLYKSAEAQKNVPAIRIGAVNDPRFRPWEHHIEVKGRDILLYGRDRKALAELNRWSEFEHAECGSAKAVVVFLEKFAGTSFVHPGATGVRVQRRNSVSVPEGFHFRGVPAVTAVTGLYRQDPSAYMFILASNCFPAASNYITYGGHSHEAAVPIALRQSHPEYFAVLGGRRTTRPKHCLSHPEVARRIYAELLKQCDRGYEMVQLGQSDGSGACECAGCAKLYGVAELGEKLWIMHRDMAERLLKERPGKKVCILAYGPTRIPPRTFRKFPANVKIELAPCDAEDFARWRGYEVPLGFAAYLYNWGVYHWEGFTPKRTFEFLRNQARLLRREKVDTLYRCGGRELFGLEGPAYYMFGRLLADPELSPESLLDSYCSATFGGGAKAMKKFYLLLDSRLKIDLRQRSGSEDWNDARLLSGALPPQNDNVMLHKARYPEKVVSELEKLLHEAESEAGKNSLLPLIRIELNYLRHLSVIFAALDRYRQGRSDADFSAVVAALENRRKFIDALPVWKNSHPVRCGFYTPAIRIFGGQCVSVLRVNGYLSGKLIFWPFGSDLKWMQENRINPGRREIVSGSAPQYLIQNNIYPQAPEIRKNYRTVQIRHDERNLYVEVRFGSLPLTLLPKEKVSIYIGRGQERFLIANSRLFDGENVWYGKRKLTSKENGGKGDVYERKVIRSRYTLLPEKSGASGVLVTIAWSEIGGRAERFDFNVSTSGPQNHGLSLIWNYNPESSRWPNAHDLAGTLLITPKK